MTLLLSRCCFLMTKVWSFGCVVAEMARNLFVFELRSSHFRDSGYSGRDSQGSWKTTGIWDGCRGDKWNSGSLANHLFCFYVHFMEFHTRESCSLSAGGRVDFKLCACVL